MFAFACLLAALGASATLPTSPPTQTATLRARQNSGGAIFPDPTAQPIFPDPTTRTTSISSSHPQIVDPPTLASGLQTSATVPVATSMGLIVPAAYPYKEVYAGELCRHGLADSRVRVCDGLGRSEPSAPTHRWGMDARDLPGRHST